MRKGGEGGGNTLTGLVFEEKTDVEKLFSKIPGYKVERSNNKAGTDIFYDGHPVARCFKKHEFYKFLKQHGINWKQIISAQLLPDSALLVLTSNTLFIIEIKYQQVSGSVDEKLQTCEFKKMQYEKLVKPLNIKVEFVYLLHNWFKHPKYRDVFDYIKSVSCHYFFDEIPLSFLGLPHKTDK